MTAPYADILQAAGWPRDVLVLDFETYFDNEYTLDGVSTIEYIQDRRFEEHGLASLRMRVDRPSKSGFNPCAEETLDWAKGEYGPSLEGCTVVMQNAFFDAAILAFKHSLYPRWIIDTKNLAMAFNPYMKHSLAHLAKWLGLNPKGDTENFRGLRWATMTEIQRKALADYACNDVDLEFQVFTRMLPLFSNPSFELVIQQHTLELFTRPCIGVDQERAVGLIEQMKAKVDELLTACGTTHEQISGNKSFEKLLRAELGDNTPMKQGKKGPILALAKGDSGLEFLQKHPSDRVRALAAARVGVKSWPTHIKRVTNIAAQARAAGGLLPVPLHYCGAHTGRWSGGQKINLQNLGARSVEPLINQVRELLIAPPGMTLVAADASQIEARGTAWIAGQWDLVEDFANGVEVYCKFISGLLGKKIRKVRKDDPPPLAKYLSAYRQQGKIGVLGCGYGMGWKKLQVFSWASYHVMLSDAEAQRIVAHYRATNSSIVKFWGQIEYAFKYVTKYKHESMKLDRGLDLWHEANQTIIKLPSGRLLRYPEAGVSAGLDQYDRPVERLYYSGAEGKTYIWGGYLTENIVQALSRDILAEAVLNVDRRGTAIGLRVGHHVHDEIIGVVPIPMGRDALALMIDELRRRPAWAPECPLDAEGRVCRRYGK